MRPAHGDAEPARRGSGSTDRAPDGFPSAAASAVHVRRGASLLRHLCCAALVTPLFLHRLPDRLRCAVGLRAASCADAFPPAHCRLPHGCALAAVLQKSRFPRRSCCFRPAERPSLPSPQAETFCRISAHESPATGPFRLPQVIRPQRPASCAVASADTPSRRPEPPANALPKDPPEHVSVASPAFNDAPHRESAARSLRTNSCPPFGAFPSPSSPDAGQKKEGGIIFPPSCHRFQRVEIGDCPDRIIRLCRAAHAQNRADRTDADPPFFRRGPQR